MVWADEPTPTPVPAAPASAPSEQARPLFIITLNSGEILKGPLTGAADADPVILEHPVFGRMSLAKALVKSIAPEPPTPPTPPAPAASPAPPPAPPTPAPAAEAPKPPAAAAAAAPPPPSTPATPPAPAPPPPAPTEFGLFDKWTGNFEAGFNTASGNSDRVATRIGLGLRREVPETVTTFNGTYNFGRNNDGISEDRARLDLRNDWVQQGGSSWRLFVAGSGEYERFQPWEWRVGVNGGVGYDFIKDKTFTLVGRAGFGGSREYGDLSHGTRAEITPGLDFQWIIDERSKLTASFDYYRDLDEFSVYRFIARCAYDVLILPESNLTLRVGIEDRYDETTLAPRENNDFELFTAIVFKF